MSNPLFIAWAVVPLFAILILCLLTKVAFRQVSAVAIVLSIGSVLGIIARIPFKAILVQDNAAKIRPDLASQSLAYYSGLLLDRLKTGWGVVALVVILALLALAAIGLATALKRRQTGSTIISGIALLGPLSATVGAVMLGTFAARYLEPVVFLAPLSLVTLPLLLPRASQLTRKRIANNLPRLTGTLALLALVVCIAVLSSIRTIGTPDASLACAEEWIATHPGYGAGQFWSVRAVKAYSVDPRRLIQVDQDNAPYIWLSNAQDVSESDITFTITDSASPPFGQMFANPNGSVACGRYTIKVYRQPVPLGISHH